MKTSSIVTTLIQDGESKTVDFKRQVELDTARGKSEFIKDVLAIANSADYRGYLLIGVEDSGTISGIESFNEEQIQQIVSTYITPPLSLKCNIFPVSENNQLKIGVIEILGQGKPYKTSRAIDKIEQNVVFIRHGTVIAKASPEEIINMHNLSRSLSEGEQYIRSAEVHLNLGNIQSAINAYSKAIDVAPNAEYLVARGRAYRQLISEKEEKTLGKYPDTSKYVKLAAKDFSDAIAVSDLPEYEAMARVERLRLHLPDERVYPEWKSDIKWLKNHLGGVELGEIYYLEAETYRVNSYLFREEWCHEPNCAQKAIECIDKALELNYKTPEVFLLRSQAYHGQYNFGLALKDVEYALSGQLTVTKRLQALSLKANILVYAEQYEDAYKIYEELQQKYRVDGFSYFDAVFLLNIQFLCRYAIESRFGTEKEILPKSVLRAIFSELDTQDVERIKKEYPLIAQTMEKMLTDF